MNPNISRFIDQTEWHYPEDYRDIRHLQFGHTYRHDHWVVDNVSKLMKPKCTATKEIEPNIIQILCRFLSMNPITKNTIKSADKNHNSHTRIRDIFAINSPRMLIKSFTILRILIKSLELNNISKKIN